MYEAALDQSLWVSVLEEICRASGSIGAHIVPLDNRFSPGVPATPSVMEAMDAYFREGWDKRDLRFSFAPVAAAKGITVEHDHFTDAEMERLPYYKDFLGKYGFRYSAMIAFRYQQNLLSLGLQRGVKDEPFDSEDEKILVRMQSHLTSAMQVMHGIEKRHVDGMIDAFDRMATACIFFDGAGKVVAVNGRASRLFGPDVDVANGEFVVRRAAAAVAVRKHLRKVLDGGLFVDPEASAPVLIERPQARPLVLRAQRLPGGAFDIFSTAKAVALLVDLDDRRQASADLLRQMFALTQQEIRMAEYLAKGLGAKDIAGRLHLNYETVRTHVKNVMRKTGTTQQSEVASLLSALLSVRI